MTDSTNPTGDSFSFVDAEHAVLEFWESSDVFKQSLAQTEKGRHTSSMMVLRLPPDYRTTDTWSVPS